MGGRKKGWKSLGEGSLRLGKGGNSWEWNEKQRGNERGRNECLGNEGTDGDGCGDDGRGMEWVERDLSK